MRDQTVARSYAEALLELADRHEGLDAFSAAVELVARLLEEDPRFRLFLETPRVDASARKEVLRAAFADRVPRAFLNFLMVTVDKRRQRLLRSIAREFHRLVDERLGRAHVEVTAARELDPSELEEVARRVSALLQKQAIPHLRVRPEILGGIILRTGDTIYDGSVRRRLEGMRRALLGAGLPAS